MTANAEVIKAKDVKQTNYLLGRYIMDMGSLETTNWLLIALLAYLLYSNIGFETKLNALIGEVQKFKYYWMKHTGHGEDY